MYILTLPVRLSFRKDLYRLFLHAGSPSGRYFAFPVIFQIDQRCQLSKNRVDISLNAAVSEEGEFLALGSCERLSYLLDMEEEASSARARAPKQHRLSEEERKRLIERQSGGLKLDYIAEIFER